LTACLRRRANGDKARNWKDSAKSREDTGTLEHVLVIGWICRVQQGPRTELPGPKGPGLHYHRPTLSLSS